MTRYQIGLLTAFIAFWVWAAINPVMRHDWLLESYPIFYFVPIVIVVGRLTGFSSASYTCIAIFMAFHMVGTHYTYPQVPFGYALGEWFGTSRNMYDRLVHFGFGFLISYPAFEMFKKLAKVNKWWNYFFTFNFIMSLSAGYEIIEWVTSVYSSPQATLAYIGFQGDIWDTQKDMYMAGLGCLLMLVIIFLMVKRSAADLPVLIRRFAVIGSPVSHSLSPQLFNGAFETLGINAQYEAREVSFEALKKFLNRMRAGAYEGISVTIPHKETALALVDSCSPEAEKIGAINTIVREGKKLIGHNTDWMGVRYALRSSDDLRNKKILLFGAGGAARACIFALQSLGVKDIYIMNRSEDKAMKIADEFGITYVKTFEIPIDILINATSIGIQPIDIFPVSNDFLSRIESVFDMIYGPTDLKTRAERLGKHAIDGKEMLAGQAAPQFKLFMGNDIPPELLSKQL